MDAKIAGEDKLWRLYARPELIDKGIGYTVVRPGGLTRDAAIGVGAIELNQGDEKSGRIARERRRRRPSRLQSLHATPRVPGWLRDVGLHALPVAGSDVAAICIQCLGSAAAFDTTFECYYADTAKGLEDVMASNAKAVGTGVQTQATALTSGLERRADTWPKLFEGLKRDVV